MNALRAQVAPLLLAIALAPCSVGAQASRDSLARGVLLRELADSTFWPEGVDRDPRTGDLYVASVRHRTIVRVSKTGAEHELWPRDDRRFGAMLGVRVDPRRPLVWATTSGIPQTAGWAPADSAIAALLRIDARTGRILRRWDLLLAPEPTIGTMMGDRFVYVANSQWEEYDDAGHLKPGARLARPRLVAVPVPRGAP